MRIIEIIGLFNKIVETFIRTTISFVPVIQKLSELKVELIAACFGVPTVVITIVTFAFKIIKYLKRIIKYE